MAKKELDYMESYTTDALAQAAYVSNANNAVYTSQYPTQDADHVKVTSYLAVNQEGYRTTDPANSLTGAEEYNQWLSDYPVITNQRFHIDLGSAKAITRIYYENSHTTVTYGYLTDRGAKNFTFWGSNTADDFADLTYANDGTWVQLTGLSQSTFDQHSEADAADPKYITVTNTTAYRYYAFKFADNWGSTQFLAVRRIELQTSIILQCFSEPTIKTQGTYSLKGVAAITDSSGKTLTRTVSPTIDLTGQTQIKYDQRAGRTGSNIKIGIRNKSIEQYFETSLVEGGSVYGGTGTNEELDQSFQVSGTVNISRVGLHGGNFNSPTDNVVIRIETDNGGIPSGTLVNANATVAIAATSWPTRPTVAFVEADFPATFQLVASTTYHLRISRSGSRDTTNRWCSSANLSGGYANGRAWAKADGTWGDYEGVSTADLGFRLYKQIITEHTHNQTADAFETATVDISGVADADKNAIDQIKFTIMDATAANTFYLDNMFDTGCLIKKIAGVTQVSTKKISGVVVASINKVSSVVNV